MTIREALEAVVYESKNDYAIQYALAGLEMGGSEEAHVIDRGTGIEIKHRLTGKIMIGQELKTQLLYILCNLSGWRGERAREVKAFLKKCAK